MSHAIFILHPFLSLLEEKDEGGRMHASRILQISEWSYFYVGAWVNSPALSRRFTSFPPQLNRVPTFAVDDCFYCWVTRHLSCATDVVVGVVLELTVV